MNASRKILAVCLFTMLSLFGNALYAAVPANDICANAAELTNGMSLTIDTTEATSTNEPTTLCGYSFGRGVWYKVTPTNNSRVYVNTCGSSYDTIMGIYTGPCPATNNYVTCNDTDSSCGGGSKAGVSFGAFSNITYYVLIGGYQAVGGLLQVNAQILPPPTNDTCANAVALASGVTYSNNITQATELGDTVPGCGANIGHGVWFTVTPTNNQRVNISTAGSDFATLLAVYTNSCGSLGNAVDYFGNSLCSGGQFSAGASSVSFSSRSNVTYRILVGTYGAAAAGNLRITATLTNPPSNDTCANAVALVSGVTYSNNIAQATELGDTVPGCGANIGHGVWFTVTPTNNQRVNISTAGSDFATLLAVYTNSCGSLGNAVDYFGNSLCSGGQFSAGASSVSFSSRSNVTYRILVGTYGAAAAGNLRITATLTNPPSNDTCANAVALVSGVTYSNNIAQATELGDTVPGCGANIGHGVWFTVTPTNNQRVNISTAGSDFATLLAVYTNSCGSLGNAVDYFGNSLCSGGQFSAGASSVSFSSRSNVTYRILVGTYGAAAAGNLRITATLTNPPSNDTCANAVALVSGVTYSNNIAQATELGDTVPGCGANIGHGVWFTVTPTNNQRVNISTAGSDFATLLAVYTNSCGSLGNAVDYFGNSLCSGGQFSAGASSVSFSSRSNVTYRILVGTYGAAAAGNLRITATLTNPPSNDTCANAVALVSGVTYSNNIAQATELGDTVPGCGANIGHGVWFTVTPTNNQRVNISTAGSDFATLLAVYTNSCGSLGNAVDYFGNSLCSGGQFSAGASSVSFSSRSNVTYRILVGTYGAAAAGNLRITATLTNPPSNDTCANAVALVSGVTYSNNIAQATELGDTVPGCGANIGHGVWFTVTPTNNQRVNISTAGSDFATLLAVYTNSCGSLGNAVDYFGNSLCSGGQFSAGASSVSFSSRSNVTYRILVGTYGAAAAGNLRITATLTNPPSNDTCANAVALVSGVTNIIDTTQATEFGDTYSCNASAGRGVWYKLVPPSGARVTINTCGSSFNTVMQIFRGSCDALTNFLCANQSGPVACSGRASVNFTDVGAQTYHILVGGNGGTGGDLRIVADVVPPNNDQCSNAIPMTAGTPYTVNTLNATETNDPMPACHPNLGRGVWYSFTPTASHQYALTTCGSSFQTALAIYKDGCGVFTPVACVANSGPYCGGGRASLDFAGVAGTTYHILAGGFNGAAGDLSILVTDYDLVSSNLFVTNQFTTNVPTNTIVAGRNAQFNWTVRNIGANSLSATWTDRLSLSNAFTNVIVADFTASRTLASGSSYPQGGLRLVPAIPNGAYTLFAFADVGGQVAEISELNNVISTDVFVTNIPPVVTLTSPTNDIRWIICGPAPLKLSAQTQLGSYAIRRVEYFADAVSIGQSTNAPYRVTSLGLTQGVYRVRAEVEDVMGLRSVSTNQVQVTLTWPGLHQLHAELDTNGVFVGCCGVQLGSNYMVQTTTNLQSSNTIWGIFLITNQVASTNLVFTNRPLDFKRFFQLQQLP